MSKEISIADEAKHHLAVELGNQSRFLYEYGYSQIVDILDKGGFLRTPEPVSVEEAAKALFADDKIRVLVELPEEMADGTEDEYEIPMRDAVWGDKIYGHNKEDYLRKAKLAFDAVGVKYE